MAVKVSVILCAHNPRLRHFEATLEGLRAQDLPMSEWELIVVDNASQPTLASQYSVTWHPNGRIIAEPELGLARARRRGYLTATGELVVHSDDDNILAPDYLRTTLEIQYEHPHIGCFGGQWTPRFDRAPRSLLEYSFGGERKLKRDRWSNILDDPQTMPFGAGMCIRREVIAAYLSETEKDPRRLVLGRTGNRFITGEDIDLNFVAVRAGFGTGLFRRLSLIHLIPIERMTATHVIRYRAGNAYSMVLLHFLHFGHVYSDRRSRLESVVQALRSLVSMTRFDRRMDAATRRARAEAVADMRRWGWV